MNYNVKLYKISSVLYIHDKVIWHLVIWRKLNFITLQINHLNVNFKKHQVSKSEIYMKSLSVFSYSNRKKKKKKTALFCVLSVHHRSLPTASPLKSVLICMFVFLKEHFAQSKIRPFFQEFILYFFFSAFHEFLYPWKICLEKSRESSPKSHL